MSVKVDLPLPCAPQMPSNMGRCPVCGRIRSIAVSISAAMAMWSAYAIWRLLAGEKTLQIGGDTHAHFGACL
ncbi:MAG: hypothetical protein AB7L36_05680, partial [Sphingomonadaceae bacterium]